VLDRRHARAVRLAGIVVTAVAAATIVAGAAAAQQTQPAGWPQFQGGPGHEGFRDDGPAPPYRVRWSVADPSGDRLSAAIVVGEEAITLGPEAVYGVNLGDGAIAWDIPRAGGPLSVPAVGTAGGQDVLVYLEGPASSPGAEPSPTPTTDATTAPATGATATTSPGTTDDDDEAVSELVGVTLSDRTERWRVRLGAIARSGVTIDGDTVYVGDQDGTLAAYALDDGTSRWSNTVNGRIDSPVAAADGAVFVVARDTDESRVTLVSFDAATGERSWPFEVPATSTAGSAASVADGRVILGSADRVVRAVSADEGTEEWTSLVLTLFPPATAPAIGDGSVFAADFGGGLYRLDAADGGRMWSHQLNEVILRGAPVVSGDAVLVGLADGRLVAVDVGSGHLVWQDDLTEGALGAVAIADDALIAVTGGPDAGLVALEHDPEGALVDVPSPTEFDPGTTFARYAAAAAVVFVVSFVPGIYARRRFGTGIPVDDGVVEPDEDADPDGPGDGA
jgi:outer membrane protein assembly factor BamB